MRRPGSGPVVALVVALAVTLLTSAGIAAVAPSTPPGTGTPTRTVTSTTGRFSLSLPSSYTIQADTEDSQGRLLFAASAGDGYGDYEAEGISLVLLPGEPGTATPDDAADMRTDMDDLTRNGGRCAAAGAWTDTTGDAITPPEGDDEHADWEWRGCPNGWVERDFAYFEPLGRGVVISARSQDSATAKNLVSQTLDSLHVTG